MRNAIEAQDGLYPVQRAFTFPELHGGITEAKAKKSINKGRRSELRTVAGVDVFWYLSAKFGRMVKIEADQSLPNKMRIEAGIEAVQLAFELMPYVLPKLRQIDVVSESTTAFTLEIGAAEPMNFDKEQLKADMIDAIGEVD
jgi:hypothetical protein